MRKRQLILLIITFLLLSLGAVFGQTEMKPVLAVLSLLPENVSEADARIITGFIQEELFNTNDFVLVERTNVDKLLNELQYQQSGICDLKCAVSIGKQLAANKVLIGSIGRLGNAYTIQVKLIDIASNQIEKINSILAECRLEELPSHISELIRKLIIARDLAMPTVMQTHEVPDKPQLDPNKPMPKKEEVQNQKPPLPLRENLKREPPKIIVLPNKKYSISLSLGYHLYQKETQTGGDFAGFWIKYPTLFVADLHYSGYRFKNSFVAEIKAAVILGKYFKLSFALLHSNGFYEFIYDYYENSGPTSNTPSPSPVDYDFHQQVSEKLPINFTNAFLSVYLGNNWLSKKTCYFITIGLRYMIALSHKSPTNNYFINSPTIQYSRSVYLEDFNNFMKKYGICIGGGISISNFCLEFLSNFPDVLASFGILFKVGYILKF